MVKARDERKTKIQLIEELNNLRHRINILEATENLNKQAGELLHILRINLPVGMYIVQDRKFVFTNKQFQSMTGLKNKNLTGTYPLERVHPDDREKVRENAIKMLKGTLTSPYKYRIINNDGEIRWTMEGVVSVQYLGKRAVLGHSMDITSGIEAEEKLRELYEKERKLRQQLEEEVRKRIEFTRALVHELKTPITPILFSSELLVTELKEEPWLSIARNINRGANNLNHRIDDLLDLARVEIGSLKLHPKMVDASQLLNNIAEYVAALMKKNRHTLVLDIPVTLPKVWADQERLQQIILNLLINASKFTPEGGTITLAARVMPQDLVVEIQDTGMGIPKKQQKHIFEPYQRWRTDGERLSGLGLGLSLCRYLVKLHNGKIWVKSQTGKGSTFSFSIPLKDVDQIEDSESKE